VLAAIDELLGHEPQLIECLVEPLPEALVGVGEISSFSTFSCDLAGSGRF
jgi:hypothetical protein